MLKICIFSANYLPNVGGVERYTYHVAKELIKLGTDVTVVTNNVFSLESKSEEDGIKIYRLPSFNFMNGRFPFPKRNGEYKRLYSEIFSVDYDLVLVNTRFYFHSLNAVKNAAKRKIKCAVVEHGTGHLNVGNKVFNIAGELFEHFITARIKSYKPTFYGVSNGANKWLAHFGITPSGLFSNAVDTEAILRYAAEKKRDFRRENGVSEDADCICFAGRMIPEKGIFETVAAVKRLKKEGYNVCLLAAGDGPLFNEIKKEECDFIKAVGGLEFEDLISLYKDCGIYCLPSVSEGFCSAFLEATVCDEVSVITNVGIVPEAASDGASAFIIKEISEDGVYTALKKAVLLSPEERKSMINAAKEKIKECGFSFGTTAEKILKKATEE